VSDLLKAGANPNSVYKDGYAAIHFATSNRNFEVIVVLIEAGADLFLKSNSGDTALSIAIGTGEEDLINFIHHTEQEIRHRQVNESYHDQTSSDSHRNVETETDGYQAITNKEKIFHAARLGDVLELQQLVRMDATYRSYCSRSCRCNGSSPSAWRSNRQGRERWMDTIDVCCA